MEDRLLLNMFEGYHHHSDMSLKWVDLAYDKDMEEYVKRMVEKEEKDWRKKNLLK